ncbi:MAG: hypothetical protein M2R45_03331 [Verrucomicrobia subdivision 3 bacterium]|nr:hypothetical protein [Limisphaerales bacterium]MCS1415388.1 hypothetical protein [Limisphaerales bacterium]
MYVLREIVDLALRVFALGLFVSVILNWIASKPPNGFRKQLNGFYDIFLNPLRRYLKPVKLSPSAPAGLDLSPLVLLLIVWWAIYPFLMWVFGR